MLIKKSIQNEPDYSHQIHSEQFKKKHISDILTKLSYIYAITDKDKSEKEKKN